MDDNVAFTPTDAEIEAYWLAQKFDDSHIDDSEPVDYWEDFPPDDFYCDYEAQEDARRYEEFMANRFC